MHDDVGLTNFFPSNIYIYIYANYWCSADVRPLLHQMWMGLQGIDSENNCVDGNII